jgi:hypothetical protein
MAKVLHILQKSKALSITMSVVSAKIKRAIFGLALYLA